MSEIFYRVDASIAVAHEAFSEASREELRVLIALLASGDHPQDPLKLARAARVSSARLRASLALWEEAGVITPVDSFAEVSEEFEPVHSERVERSLDVAEQIRDEGLAELITECGVLLERPGLSTDEIKELSSLYMEENLSAEYIIALVAYLASKQKAGSASLGIRKVAREARKLVKSGVDTLEGLEAYVKGREEELRDEWEYRRVLGLWGRSLSHTEREYFRHWAEDLGYSVPIVEEAYGITSVNTGKASLPYMNKLLEAWHGSGCKTLAECRAASEITAAKLKEDHEPRRRRSPEAEKPKYSDFDSEDALMRAIERSYSENK